MSILFRRRKLLRGESAALDLFNGYEGELGYATDTKLIRVFDGTTMGGVPIGGGGTASLPPGLVADISGVASSSSDYQNWTYDTGLLEPDGSDYFSLATGLYVLKVHGVSDPNAVATAMVIGDHVAAHTAETYQPRIIAEIASGIAVPIDFDKKNRNSNFDVVIFGVSTLNGSDTDIAAGDGSSSVVTAFYVAVASTIRFAYADVNSTVTANVNLGDVRMQLYGPQQS